MTLESMIGRMRVVSEDKKRFEVCEGAMFAFETPTLGRLFEPYFTLVLPMLLTQMSFGNGIYRGRARMVPGSMSQTGDAREFRGHLAIEFSSTIETNTIPCPLPKHHRRRHRTGRPIPPGSPDTPWHPSGSHQRHHHRNRPPRSRGPPSHPLRQCRSLFRRHRQKAVVKSAAYDRHLGGRDIGSALFQHFDTKFKTKYKSGEMATFRLGVGCERLKEILSANSEAPLSVDSIMNEVNASSKLSRDAYEALAASVVDGVNVPLSGLPHRPNRRCRVHWWYHRVLAVRARVQGALGGKSS